jgi:hypothetical protein
VDQVAAGCVPIVLGKALFWDGDVGSDKQACASCHFHAGADDRVKNQFNPGFPITADFTFGDAAGLTGSGATAGPNYTVVAGDFPLHRLSDPEDRQSAVLYDTNDRFSSQGTFNGAFVSTPILPILGTDNCLTPDPATNPFHVGSVIRHRSITRSCSSRTAIRSINSRSCRILRASAPRPSTRSGSFRQSEAPAFPESCRTTSTALPATRTWKSKR